MRANVLLSLATALLTTGCASSALAPGQERHLRYAPPDAPSPALTIP